MTTPPASTSDQPHAASRLSPKRVIYWAATAIVLAETALGGLYWDLFRIPYVVEIFEHLGYPLYLLTIMGIAKGLALVALLVPGFPRLKEWAYAGLFFVYAGAVASHWAVGDPAAVVLSPGGFGVLLLVSHALRPPVRTRFRT